MAVTFVIWTGKEHMGEQVRHLEGCCTSAGLVVGVLFLSSFSYSV